MKVGDPKKSAILGVVAVGAVAFLVIRMLPAGGPKALRTASAETADQPASSRAVAMPPMTLVNDPFSHPDLAEKKKKPELGPNGETNIDGGAGTFPKPPTTDPAPYRPMRGDIGPGAKGSDMSMPSVTPNGSKVNPAAADPPPAKPGTNVEQHVPVTLTLNGVVSAGHAVAFIALGKGDPQAYEIGQSVPTVPPMRVADIQEGSVLLKLGRKSVLLTVGHEAKL